MAERHALRFTGADPATVDPYWDFEHESGGGYDMRNVRPWRARLFTSGATHGELRLLRSGSSRSAVNRPALGRLSGAMDGRALTWLPLRSPRFPLGGPSVLVGADLTSFSPGHYVLELHVAGATAFDRRHTFAVFRRSYYTFGETIAPTPTPRGVSTTGLQEILAAGHRHLAAAHAWTVYEHSWDDEISAYERRALRVVALTLFDRDTVVPIETRITVGHRPDDLASFSRQDFDTWSEPGDHALPPTADTKLHFALPLPILTGLPKQPGPRGRFTLQPS